MEIPVARICIFSRNQYQDANHSFDNLRSMIRPIKYDKAVRHRKSKTYKSNIAVHPFVIFAVTAAVAIVIFGVLAYFFWYVK